jgi:hypothetical protein
VDPSFTGGKETEVYTGQPSGGTATPQNNPPIDPSQQLPGAGQTGYGSYGVPDAGVRQQADAGNWYTLEQSNLYLRNQQLSAQIDFQLMYLHYLKATTSYGNTIPSIEQFAWMARYSRPTLGPPGQLILPPPGGSISALPDDYVPGPSISDAPPIWQGLTNTMFTDAQSQILNSTLLDPGSYLAVLPAEAIGEIVFGEALEAGSASALEAGSAGARALRTGPAAAFPDVLGNIEGDPGFFGITTDTTYLVRAGSPGVPGSWGDHLFESLGEARVYAERLAASGQQSIRNFSALSRIWPGGAQGNAVETISIWRVPAGTKHTINVVGPQFEGGTVFGAPLLYRGGGPQVIIERGVRLDLVAPEVPVLRP